MKRSNFKLSFGALGNLDEHYSHFFVDILQTGLVDFCEQASASNSIKDSNHVARRSRGFPLTPCCLSPQVECSCWTWGTPPARTASGTPSELVPRDTPAWRPRQSSVTLWWSASSPSAPVGGSTEARWGKKRKKHSCIQVCIVPGRMYGRPEISKKKKKKKKEVKGHFGECAPLLCEWRRSQGRMKERGSEATSGNYRESGKREEESDTFQEGKRKKRGGREGRKTPLFPLGGRGNSEPGCHVDNCLHLHLSSPQ